MFLAGKGITKVCAIWLQPKGEHMSQVDLLVVYAYYAVWNFRWNFMCLSRHAIIVALGLGVLICVVYGQAWDNVTTQSWSLNMSYLILSFPDMLNRF
jgi:hypothetical protein